MNKLVFLLVAMFLGTSGAALRNLPRVLPRAAASTRMQQLTLTPRYQPGRRYLGNKAGGGGNANANGAKTEELGFRASKFQGTVAFAACFAWGLALIEWRLSRAKDQNERDYAMEDLLDKIFYLNISKTYFDVR